MILTILCWGVFSSCDYTSLYLLVIEDENYLYERFLWSFVLFYSDAYHSILMIVIFVKIDNFNI